MNKKTFLFLLVFIFSVSLVYAFEDQTILDRVFDGNNFFGGVITGFGIFNTGELFLNQQVNRPTSSSTPQTQIQSVNNGGDDGENNCPPTAIENCWTVGDEDCNGLSDCADPICSFSSQCIDIAEPLPEICDDGLDNDLDGLKDCGDIDCVGNSACNTDDNSEGFNAGYNTDNDLYNFGLTKEQYCNNHKDDDTDGYIDCADADCTNDLYCATKEVCDNGIDDNNNGYTDCDDATCLGAPNCGVQEDCNDGIDNDKDGYIDCADSNCALICIGSPEICNDGIDNDKDGMIDCVDPNCVGVASCLQVQQKLTKSKELSPEEKAVINEYFREANKQILLMSAAVDKLENLAKDDPVWQQDIRRDISYPLGVFAGRTSRASVEISKGNIDKKTVKELVKRFNDELIIIQNRITDTFDKRVQTQLREKYQ